MFFNAFEKDNKIVYLPGIDSWNPNVPSRFDIYDVTTNTWSIGVLPQSSQSIAHGSIISVNNTIYGAGGSFINGVLSNQVWKLVF
jgi:N-acetylneuraminic acid mutarotase